MADESSSPPASGLGGQPLRRSSRRNLSMADMSSSRPTSGLDGQPVHRSGRANLTTADASSSPPASGLEGQPLRRGDRTNLITADASSSPPASGAGSQPLRRSGRTRNNANYVEAPIFGKERKVKLEDADSDYLNLGNNRKVTPSKLGTPNSRTPKKRQSKIDMSMDPPKLNLAKATPVKPMTAKPSTRAEQTPTKRSTGQSPTPTMPTPSKAVQASQVDESLPAEEQDEEDDDTPAQPRGMIIPVEWYHCLTPEEIAWNERKKLELLKRPTARDPRRKQKAALVAADVVAAEAIAAAVAETPRQKLNNENSAVVPAAVPAIAEDQQPETAVQSSQGIVNSLSEASEGQSAQISPLESYQMEVDQSSSSTNQTEANEMDLDEPCDFNPNSSDTADKTDAIQDSFRHATSTDLQPQPQPRAQPEEEFSGGYTMRQLYPTRIANPRCARYAGVFSRPADFKMSEAAFAGTNPQVVVPPSGDIVIGRPNPNSRSLFAQDRWAAELFQSGFDQALGLSDGKQLDEMLGDPKPVPYLQNRLGGGIHDDLIDDINAELSQPAEPDTSFASTVRIIAGGDQLLELIMLGMQPQGDTPEDGQEVTLDLLVNAFSVAYSETPGIRKPAGLVGGSGENEKQEPFPREVITDYLRQMMYVSGETGEPSVETTGIIEDIVRAQVVEILRSCTELASRRGSRAITINDLIFQIRDDAPKVSRLRTFLSWKDVRKNVKDSDDKGGEADLGAGEDPVGGVVPGGPVDDTTKKNKKSKVGLPWEPASFFPVEVPEREDEEDEEEEEMNHITLQRLRKADERTKAMTKEEYVTWSEYRQASFTYRKGKRFREWAGFGVVTDSKPSDDIVDILGFLTFEMVQTLTEEALKIKENEDQHRERNGDGASAAKKRKYPSEGLFAPPSEGRSPVEPRHIQEAFRRLQERPKKHKAMLNFTRIGQRTNLKLF